MRIKWNFRNQTSENFSEFQLFKVKLTWKPPIWHPNLEVFVSPVEEDLFKLTDRAEVYT